jgi:hypothetical protein
VIDNLVQFLRDRLNEDERIAREATPGPWEWRLENDDPWAPERDGWLDYSGEYIAAAGDEATLFGPGMTPPADAVHIARHDPARALAEVDAKRRIIDRATGTRAWAIGESGRTAGTAVSLANDTLRALALPYTDHPDYRDEWRP